MEIDNNIANLICELEYKIGNQTYNPNSYNGWTGEEGCGFKYPVNYCISKSDLEEHKQTKTRSKINAIEPECIGTMKYAFGSNHLYIGNGLVEALKYLEELYQIDFNELELRRKERRLAKLAEVKSVLDKKDTVMFIPGKYLVGTDLPEGKWKIVNECTNGYSRYVIVEIYNRDAEKVESVFMINNEERKIKLENGYTVVSDTGFGLKNM